MAVESQDDQPSSVSNTQIHKEIRCVCALFVAANQGRDRLPLKIGIKYFNRFLLVALAGNLQILIFTDQSDGE